MIAFDFAATQHVHDAHVLECAAPLGGLRSRVVGTKTGPDLIAAAIAQLQSRVVYQIAQTALVAWRGCDIERSLLGAGYDEDNRPRWWSRLHKGTLRIAPALARGDPEARSWMARLRLHTTCADEALALPLWRLADPRPIDIADLLDHRGAIDALRVPTIKLCNGTQRDARRLCAQVRQMFCRSSGLAAMTGLLYFFHLSRAFADPASQAIAFSCWVDVIATQPVHWVLTPARLDLMGFVGWQFATLRLRGPADSAVEAAIRLAGSGGSCVRLRPAGEMDKSDLFDLLRERDADWLGAPVD